MITAHLKCRGTAPTRQANLKPPINDGGAPIKSDRSDMSNMSDQAPHRTLMHNQTAFQYWRALVISHTFGCEWLPYDQKY